MPPTTSAPEAELDLTSVATAVVRELVGTADTPGPLSTAIEQQVMGQVESRVDSLGLVDSIKEIREEIASRAPSAAAQSSYPAPPWAAAGVGDVLGLPDPNWYNPEAIGAQLDNQFESFGDFVKSVIRSDMGGTRDSRLIRVTSGGSAAPQAALTGQEIELGGALVPEQYRPQLMMIGLQPTSIRQRADGDPDGRADCPDSRDPRRGPHRRRRVRWREVPVARSQHHDRAVRARLQADRADRAPPWPAESTCPTP